MKSVNDAVPPTSQYVVTAAFVKPTETANHLTTVSR